MRCNHCGNEVPEGSVFCNQCGTKLSAEVACPACGQMIPAKSVFCPKCGKMVRNDFAPSPQSGEVRSTPQEVRSTKYEVQSAPQEVQSTKYEVQSAPSQTPAAPAPQPAAPQPVTNNQVPESNGSQPAAAAPVSHYNRNLLMGVAAVVILIGALMGIRGCNSRNDRLHPVVTDSTATAVADAGQDPMAIFTAELSRNNFAGDGAKAAAAVRIPGEGLDKPERIVGVAALNDPSNRSFYKIYTLTQNGSLWDMDLLETKYLNGRSINMDNSALIADPAQVPRAVKVNGKDGMYFAFVNMPQGGSTGRVTLCFYDVDNKTLHTLDYDGQVKTRDDGRQYIYGKPLQGTSSSEMRFLKAEAASVKKIYFPTEEELKAEEEERQKEEEEKALAGPENAAAKWTHDNGERLAALKSGEEVTMRAQPYNKPIFNMRDKNRKIESDNYIVFSDNSGSVFGFNKDTRKYFVIYTPSGGAGAATEIGFGSDNRELRMRTADGHISYDLPTDKAKLIE